MYNALCELINTAIHLVSLMAAVVVLTDNMLVTFMFIFLCTDSDLPGLSLNRLENYTTSHKNVQLCFAL